MQSEELDCVWIDREEEVSVTYTSVDELDDSSRSSRTGQAVSAILNSFSRVHVCSNAKRLREILHEILAGKDSNRPICILVSLNTASSNHTELSAPEVSNLAKDYDELDAMIAKGLLDLSALDTLQFAKLYTQCLRLNNLHCAGVASHHDLDVLRTLNLLGLDVVTNILDNSELERMALNLHISRLRKPKRKSASIEANSARYESEDVKPDEQQWEGLRGRANALVYLPVNPVRHDLVDFHMPPYEALLMPDVRDGLESLESQLPRLHKLVSTWDFSTLQLSEQDLVNCAAVIFKHLFKLPGTEEWHLTDEALFSFIGNIRRAYYTTNPYHNFRHAVDVLQAVFYMLLSSAVLPQMSETCQEFEAIGCSVLPLLMTPQYMLGACIVGIGHDVGHPGVNNALLVATKAPISLLYNDRSVLESMHCAALGRILTQKWPATQQGSMRKVIIELILSTDMALHFDYMSKFKEMEQVCIAAREAAAEQVAPVEPVEIPSATLDKYKVTLFSALIKCGDISNVARPFAISRDWSFVLLKEFFNQARLEKAMGLPVTKNFDPEQTAQADSQMFFINLFAQPLFVSLEKVLPNLMPISRTIASNHDTWKLLKADPQSLATVVDNISRPTSDLNKILAKPLAKSADFEIIRPEDDKVFVDDHNTTVANSGDIHDSQNKSKKSFSLQKLFKRKKSGVPA